jgi:hypothetical protein
MTHRDRPGDAHAQAGDADSEPAAPLRQLVLALVSILVGAVAGLGAVLLRLSIAFFHNLLFLGKLSLQYDASLYSPASPWGPLVVLVPVLGAAGVAFLAKHVVPEVKGMGVPEVMEAIYYCLIIFLTVMVVVSYAVRKILLRQSIFALALVRQGKGEVGADDGPACRAGPGGV